MCEIPSVLLPIFIFDGHSFSKLCVAICLMLHYPSRIPFLKHWENESIRKKVAFSEYEDIFKKGLQTGHLILDKTHCMKTYSAC